MRLYLASYWSGCDVRAIARLAGAGAPTAVISNAVDNIPDTAREAYARTVFDPVAWLREAGLDARPLDLRDYFGRPEALLAELETLRFLWVGGGNVFLLRRAMRQSGFDALVPGLVWAGRLGYGGWSAGACVAGPTLRGLHLMDDPHDVVEGYRPEPIWEGLGLIDAAVVPHWRSDHAEAEAADAAVAWMTENRVPYRALRDGDVLVQNGETLELDTVRT